MAIDWTDPANVSRLRSLWAAGHSTAKIGEMMGCGKNAVVGARRRLSLPERGSPIIRDVGDAVRGRNAQVLALVSLGCRQADVASRMKLGRALVSRIVTEARGQGWRPAATPGSASADTLPPLSSSAAVVVLDEPDPQPVVPPFVPGLRQAPVPPPVASFRAPAVDIRPPLPASLRVSAYRDCQWPIGLVGTRAFRFCGAGTHPGYSYCAAHCRKAFVHWSCDQAA